MKKPARETTPFVQVAALSKTDSSPSAEFGNCPFSASG